MTILIILLIIFIIILFLIWWMTRLQTLAQENRLMENYMASMEEFYQTIRVRIEDTRKYRHDLAKHIQTLNALLKRQENTDDITLYKDNLQEKYNQLKAEQYCCDEIVNSILSIHCEQCKSKGIPLDIAVDDVSYHGITELDMVGLLHNLLDNAYEAVIRIPENEEKRISVTMNRTDTEIMLQVSNHVKAGEKIAAATTKKNKAEHGIGNKIISQITNKYQGEETDIFDSENHWYTRRIKIVPAT